MLARRLTTSRKFTIPAQLSDFYSVGHAYLVMAERQPTGTFAFTMPFPYSGSTGTGQKYVIVSNVRGFMSADREAIVMGLSSTTTGQLRVLEWLSPNFDWETRTRDVVVDFGTGSANTLPTQILRNNLFRFSNAMTTVSSYSFDKVLLGQVTVSPLFTTGPFSADGRQAFTLNASAQLDKPKRSSGRRMLANPGFGAFVREATRFESNITSGVAFQIWPDEAANVSTPAVLRISEDLTTTEIPVPVIAAHYPGPPPGAETYEEWSTNVQFAILSGSHIAVRDAIYFCAEVTVNQLYKGPDAGTVQFTQRNPNSGLAVTTTEQQVWAGLSVRSMNGLYRLDPNGSITLVNIIYQLTNYLAAGITPVVNVEGQTYKVVHVTRNATTGNPAPNNYYQPRVNKTFTMDPSDITIIRNATSLTKFGKYMFVNDADFGYARLEIGKPGGIVTPQVGGRDIVSLVALENHGVIYGKAFTTSCRSLDGGVTWTTVGATPYPPSQLLTAGWLGL